MGYVRFERGDAALRHDDEPIAVTSLRPIQLSIWRMGPIRKERGFKVRFLGSGIEGTMASPQVPRAAPDPEKAFRLLTEPSFFPGEGDLAKELCNLWILQADGAGGKSTLIDAMQSLFGLMSTRPVGRFARTTKREQADAPQVAQLDLRVRLVVGETGRNVVLSLWFGMENAPVDWSELLETKGAWQAKTWARIGFMPGRTEPAEGTNDLGAAILRAVRRREGAAMPVRPSDQATDHRSRLFADAMRPLPTALRFGDGAYGAEAAMPRTAFLSGGYSPAKSFALGADSSGGLEPSLVRFGTGSVDRLDELLSHLSRIVPLGTIEPKTLVRSRRGDRIACRMIGSGHAHDLTELGAGESALLDLHGRALLNMTEATLVLIDGIDRYFDPNRYPDVLASLKTLAQSFHSVSIVATAQDPAFMRIYEPGRGGPGLVMGGEMLSADEIR